MPKIMDMTNDDEYNEIYSYLLLALQEKFEKREALEILRKFVMRFASISLLGSARETKLLSTRRRGIRPHAED